MTNELPLLAYAGRVPAQSHSVTSCEAADRIKKHIGPLHERVLAYLRGNPATDEEMCDALALGGNTLRPRRRELELNGLIENSGTTRPTKAGRNAVLWKLA